MPNRRYYERDLVLADGVRRPENTPVLAPFRSVVSSDKQSSLLVSFEEFPSGAAELTSGEVDTWCSANGISRAALEAAGVPGAEPSELYPNQPAGYQPWFEHDWSWFDKVRANMPRAATGTGWFTTAGWSGNNEWTNPVMEHYEYIDDLQGEHGFPGYIRVTMPEGFPAGSAIGPWTAASSSAGLSDAEAHTNLKEAYISFWWYFEPNPGDGQLEWPTIFRVFTINRHVPMPASCQGTADWIFGMQRSTGDPERWAMKADFACQDPGPWVHMLEWQPGQWYHVEHLWRRISGGMNAPEDFEGESEFKTWIDGVLVDDKIQNHRMQNPFRQLFMNIHNGGSVRTRTDHVRFTGVYCSGVPVD